MTAVLLLISIPDPRPIRSLARRVFLTVTNLSLMCLLMRRAHSPVDSVLPHRNTVLFSHVLLSPVIFVLLVDG